MTDREPKQGVNFSKDSRRTVVRAFSFYASDDELLSYIATYLGTSRSEAVRSAVRAFATHLAYLEGSRQKLPSDRG